MTINTLKTLQILEMRAIQLLVTLAPQMIVMMVVKLDLPVMMNHAPMMKLQLQQLNLFKENFQNKIPPVWLFYHMFQSTVLLEKVLKT